MGLSGRKRVRPTGAEDNSIESGNARPIGLGVWRLVPPITLTLLVLAWGGWHAYTSYQASRLVIARFVEGEDVRDLMLALDNRRRLAAQMAVATGQSLWADRYEEANTALARSLDTALASARDPGVIQTLDTMRELHRKTAAYEQYAVRLSFAGDRVRSEKALAQPGHLEDHAAFEDAVTTLVGMSRDIVEATLRQDRRSELLSLGVSVAVVALALIAWLVLMNRLHKSRARLVQEMDRRLKTETALRQSQKMEAVGRLVGGIAHDFNNILMAIVGNAEAARHHLTPGQPAARPLERLLEAADQANRMVRGLLTFSRKSSAERTPVDVRTLLDNTVALLDSLLPASIAVCVEVDRDRPMWIAADPAQMEQALVNLAVNARDAMPMGGRLTFRAFLTKAGTNTATRLCIEVVDTGTGMTPDVVEQAFEPFFTTRDKEHGTGLGLSIVHGIVTDHSGTIAVDSRPGEGTTMTVCLPALPSPPDIDHAAAAPAAKREAGPGGLVVVAEDNAFVRQLMAETLRDAGFDVVQVERGDAIVDAVTREAAALRLLVTDVELPGGSGLDAVRSLRAAGCTLPVIAVTGSIDRNLDTEIDGTALLLRKPFAMDDLARLARRVVASAYPSQSP